jgi:DNA primase
MAYTKSDINLIRSKIDILTYLENLGVTFRQSGTSWIAKCPVHNENTPSFHVKPANQTFHCFGCGISGDIFSLVQAMDNLQFPGAVQMLAEDAGIELKVDEDPDFKRKQRLLQITRLASEWFRYHYSQIEPDHLAKKILANSNLLDFSYLDDSVGYAPNGGLVDLLVKKSFTLQEIADAGLCRMPEEGRPAREMFRNRLVWTVYDVQGRPVGFSARKVFEDDKGPKYLNSPQTELYNKSRVLLGLSDAKKTIIQDQEVFVAEGQRDVMALKAAGKQNTVASCGTAFGDSHANMLLNLSKLGKESEKFKIVFCFDGDDAGIKAAKSVYEKNKNIHLNAYVVSIVNKDGSASDPCDFRRDYGDEELNKLITEQRVSIVEFILREELKNWNVSTPEGQSGFISKARDILSLVADPVQYSSYLRKVSSWTGISLAQLSDMARHQTKQPVAEQRVETQVEGDPFENKILAAILQYPEEAFACMSKYKMDHSFFPTRGDFSLSLIDQVEEKDVDVSNPVISSLYHLDLMIIESRKEFGVDMLFKNYCKYLYSRELTAMNARLASSVGNETSDNLRERMAEQMRLKQKYHV